LSSGNDNNTATAGSFHLRRAIPRSGLDRMS
jgi:hypothetical protein